MIDRDVIVRHRHLRSLGYCNRGSREFFKKHGLDWCAFLDSGINASVLLQTNDAMAIEVVRVAEMEAMNG